MAFLYTTCIDINSYTKLDESNHMNRKFKTVDQLWYEMSAETD